MSAYFVELVQVIIFCREFRVQVRSCCIILDFYNSKLNVLFFFMFHEEMGLISTSSKSHFIFMETSGNPLPLVAIDVRFFFTFLSKLKTIN